MAALAESASPSGAEIEVFEKIDDMMSAFKRTEVILGAVKLGVFTAAHGVQLSASEIAQKCGVHEGRSLESFLDVLVAENLMLRSGNATTGATYTNSVGADLLLGDPKAPSYLQSLEMTVEHIEKEKETWSNLAGVLRSDPAAKKAESHSHDHSHHHGDHEHHGHDVHHDHKRTSWSWTHITSMTRIVLSRLASTRYRIVMTNLLQSRMRNGRDCMTYLSHTCASASIS